MNTLVDHRWMCCRERFYIALINNSCLWVGWWISSKSGFVDNLAEIFKTELFDTLSKGTTTMCLLKDSSVKRFRRMYLSTEPPSSGNKRRACCIDSLQGVHSETAQRVGLGRVYCRSLLFHKACHILSTGQLTEFTLVPVCHSLL